MFRLVQNNDNVHKDPVQLDLTGVEMRCARSATLSRPNVERVIHLQLEVLTTVMTFVECRYISI